MNADANIVRRINRIYAAIDLVYDPEIEKCLPHVIKNDDVVVEHGSDWSAGQPTEQMNVLLHAFISQVASLHDHLRKWAKSKGKDADRVSDFLRESVDFCLVRDLNNRE